MASEQRYDVVVFEVDTGKIDQIAGTDMPLTSGSFHTAIKRRNAVLERINDLYDVAIVRAGSHVKGGNLKAEDVYQD